jgi:hypothetical protein
VSRFVLNAIDRRNLLIGAVLFVAAGFVPLIFDGYVLQLTISIAMYTALATSWLLFSGPTNYIALSTAAFFGIGMYITAGGHRSCALSGADPRFRRRRRRDGCDRGARNAAGFRRLFRYLLARSCRTGAANHDLAAACPRDHERALRSDRPQRTDVLLAVAAADRRGFPGRLVGRPLTAWICLAHHRQR